MLRREWHLPLRKLVLAMPITAAIVALAVAALTDLSWTEAFLVGALLSPTDPVLSSSVVTNPRVPRLIRHSLNLESGLNDGLALPPVLALVAALGASEQRLRVVALRAAGRDARLRLRRRHRAAGSRRCCRAAADRSDPGAPARALRARRRVPDLRRRRRCRRTATASSRCSSARSRSASAGPTSARCSRRRARRHRRDRQARRLRRVRLAADARRPVRRRLGGRRDRRS